MRCWAKWEAEAGPWVAVHMGTYSSWFSRICCGPRFWSTTSLQTRFTVDLVCTLSYPPQSFSFTPGYLLWCDDDTHGLWCKSSFSLQDQQHHHTPYQFGVRTLAISWAPEKKESVAKVCEKHFSCSSNLYRLRDTEIHHTLLTKWKTQCWDETKFFSICWRVQYSSPYGKLVYLKLDPSFEPKTVCKKAGSVTLGTCTCICFSSRQVKPIQAQKLNSLLCIQKKQPRFGRWINPAQCLWEVWCSYYVRSLIEVTPDFKLKTVCWRARSVML